MAMPDQPGRPAADRGPDAVADVTVVAEWKASGTMNMIEPQVSATWCAATIPCRACS
jgi:hypothetical protein